MFKEVIENNYSNSLNYIDLKTISEVKNLFVCYNYLFYF